ncbi:MAG: transposase [Candidatus Methanomethylophilaceae archaeon]|nr:transposase [Candidatus Methanomethylophilaceae archaeon]
MTEEHISKSDSYNFCKEHGLKIRDKTKGADGIPYDTRKGTWSDYDKAILEFGMFQDLWLTTERVELELEILNPPGKRGPKYIYPPSVIEYLSMKMASSNRPYRAVIAESTVLMMFLGLPVPTYSTLHKSRSKFDGGFGIGVMNAATEILRQRHGDVVDPVMFLESDIGGTLTPPRTDDPVKQEELDRISTEMSASMNVKVSRCIAESEEPVRCALDGSGNKIEGPGVYMEHVWNSRLRKFVKIHALVDVDTMELVSFAVTLESPGDSHMLPPIVEASVEAGVELRALYADTAYDSADNWMLMRSVSPETDFHPNLRVRFRDCEHIPERLAIQTAEDEMGKKINNRLSGYNDRWIVEAFFSVFKKLFGEGIRDRRFDRMVQTIKYRCKVYSIRRGFILDACGSSSERSTINA